LEQSSDFISHQQVENNQRQITIKDIMNVNYITLTFVLAIFAIEVSKLLKRKNSVPSKCSTSSKPVKKVAKKAVKKTAKKI
jgi:hypothetical protein